MKKDKKQQAVKVIFRKYNDGTPFAVFPGIYYKKAKYSSNEILLTCVDFSGHFEIEKKTIPAISTPCENEQEYNGLLNTLKALYGPLEIVKRAFSTRWYFSHKDNRGN